MHIFNASAKVLEKEAGKGIIGVAKMRISL